MMNGTNETFVVSPFASVLGPVGYFSLYGLSLAVFCPVQLFLNALTMAAVLTSPVFKTVQSQRIVLVHITAVGLLIDIALSIRSISGMILTSGLHGPGAGLCQLAAVVLHTALAMRNMTWATLTVVFYLVIRCGIKKVKIVPLMGAIVIMWLFAAATAIPYVTPAYNYEILLDGVICFTELSTAAIVHLALSHATAGLSSDVVAISFVAATVAYIKRNTMNIEAPLNRAMVKFTVILLIVPFITHAMNLLGLVPLALGEAATLATVVWFHLLSTYMLVSLPGIVTPLLMAATFRPVRESMKAILTCHFKKNEAETT